MAAGVEEDDLFGSAVSLDGDTALISAHVTGASVGSAWVFVRSEASWSEQAELGAADRRSGDFFGRSVNLDGDTIIVGAFGDDTDAGLNAGSAFVFVRSGASWIQQAKLEAVDAVPDDSLGIAVSLDGNTSLVGADRHDTNAGVSAGGAYVFVRSGASWSQQAKLVVADAFALDHFGSSVSLDGDTALVGAFYGDTGGAIDSGGAYTFTILRPGTVYVDDDFAGLAVSDPIADADDGAATVPATFGCDAFATVADALAVMASGGTLVVNDGAYGGDLAVPAGGTLRLAGSGGTEGGSAVSFGSLASAAGTRVELRGSVLAADMLDLGGTLVYDIQGSGPPGGIAVGEGAADIAGASLIVTVGATATVETYTVISGASPLAGTFEGLPDGAADPDAGGWEGSIAYGGSGVTLTFHGYTPIGGWRLTHFGSPANAGAGADGADGDGDDLAVLPEFAFGTDPNTGDNVQLTVAPDGMSFTRGSQDFDLLDFSNASVRFVRRIDHAAAGLAYAVQFNDSSLAPGNWEATAAAPAAVVSDGEYEVVKVPWLFFMSSGREARFVRVAVTMTGIPASP